MQKSKRFLRSIFCVVMALFMLVGSAFASAVKPTGILEITYLVKEKPVADVIFDVFHVADFDDKGQVVWDKDCEDYRLKINLEDEKRLSTMANTLSGYLKRDRVRPTMTDKTDSKGIVLFDAMNPGLYLVVGHKYEANSVEYTPVPTFAQVTANLSTELQVKYERVTIKEDTIEKRVLKSWNDDGNHPESVTVQLLKDGEVYHTKALNKGNNWRYTWTDLDPKADWVIVEASVPSGYVMESEQSGSTTIITNTKQQTPPVTPTTPEPPAVTQPKPQQTPPTPKPTPVKLPQTGLLWWPVFVMAGAGVACLIIDLMRRKEDWNEWKKVVTRRKPILLCLGSILIIAALALTCYNLVEDKNAGETAHRTLYDLRNKITETTVDEQETPDYVLSPNMDMPQVEVDNRTYIGTVSIPALSIELPIISECTPANLKAAPCLYKGSAYEDKMIIAGHNYTSHFGMLPNVKVNDEVVITDIDGNIFKYQVTGTETIDGNNSNAMEDGDWNLTLFTCTRDGRSRVTVRCVKVED